MQRWKYIEKKVAIAFFKFFKILTLALYYLSSSNLPFFLKMFASYIYFSESFFPHYFWIATPPIGGYTGTFTSNSHPNIPKNIPNHNLYFNIEISHSLYIFWFTWIYQLPFWENWTNWSWWSVHGNLLGKD